MKSIVLFLSILTFSITSLASSTEFSALIEGAHKASVKDVIGYDKVDDTNLLERSKEKIMTQKFSDLLTELLQTKESNPDCFPCGLTTITSRNKIKFGENRVIARGSNGVMSKTITEVTLTIITKAQTFKKAEDSPDGQVINSYEENTLDQMDIVFKVLGEDKGGEAGWTYTLYSPKEIIIRNGLASRTSR